MQDASPALYLLKDASTSNDSDNFDKFQEFLRQLNGVINSHSEKDFIFTLENLKNPSYKIKDPQDLNEITSLYLSVFPSSSHLKNPTPKKKWSHEKVTLLAWLVAHYSIYIQRDYDNFRENDWNYIAEMVPGWRANLIRFKWFSIQKSIEQKKQWNDEEDKKLTEIINNRQKTKKGSTLYKWTEIAEELNKAAGLDLNTRLGKHCRERWFNHLDPSFKKGEWTNEEDYEMIKLMIKLGKKWSLISKTMGSRNENSVKNRFFSLKRKYLRIYKQMPQTEKKMLLFMSQKIKSNITEMTAMESEDYEYSPKLKKIKKNPIHLRKRCLTVETKKKMNFHHEDGIMHSSLKIKSHKNGLSSTSNITTTRTTMNQSLTQLTLNSFEKNDSLKTPAEIHSIEKEKDELKVHLFTPPNEPTNEPQTRIDSPRRGDRRCFTYKNTSPDNVDPTFLSGYYAKHLNLYEIPNMYKKPLIDSPKPMLLYPNTDILNILQLPIDQINEESSKADASNELSQILSSLSLIDQYLNDGNKILSSLSFRPNANSLSSGKILCEPLPRSNFKRKTVNVTNATRIKEERIKEEEREFSPLRMHDHKISSSLIDWEEDLTLYSKGHNLKGMEPLMEQDEQQNYNLYYYKNISNYNNYNHLNGNNYRNEDLMEDRFFNNHLCYNPPQFYDHNFNENYEFRSIEDIIPDSIPEEENFINIVNGGNNGGERKHGKKEDKLGNFDIHSFQNLME